MCFGGVRREGEGGRCGWWVVVMVMVVGPCVCVSVSTLSLGTLPLSLLYSLFSTLLFTLYSIRLAHLHLHLHLLHHRSSSSSSSHHLSPPLTSPPLTSPHVPRSAELSTNWLSAGGGGSSEYRRIRQRQFQMSSAGRCEPSHLRVANETGLDYRG